MRMERMEARLDSMLFFWVVGGAAALAGNGFSLARMYVRKAVRENEGLADGVAELKLALADGLAAARLDGSISASNTAGGNSHHLQTMEGKHPNDYYAHHAEQSEHAAQLRQQLQDVASLQRWTCGAAVLGCAASIAATAAVCRGSR